MHWPGAGPAFAFLATCFAKATLFLALSWIAAIASHERSASLRHRAWAAGMLASLGLPLLMPALPSWRVAALQTAASIVRPHHAASSNTELRDLPVMIVQAASASPLAGRLPVIALAVWLVGFLLFALRLAVGLRRLLHTTAKAAPPCSACIAPLTTELLRKFELSRRIRLLESPDAQAMPLTWGIFHPVLLLPSSAEDWPEDRLRVVLLHELAHIARHDWLLQLCAEITRAIYWFHPLAWLAVRSLRHESERACDDVVLSSGVEPANYAGQLLDLARTLKHPDRICAPALAVARPSTLERRFAAMLNPSIDRTKISRKVAVFLVLATLFLVVPLAALQLPAQNVAGNFTGTIHDPSGTGVASATVIMNDHKTHNLAMTASDSAGDFSFSSLPAGEYEMKVVKSGFETYRLPQLSLAPGRPQSQDVTLEIGEVMEEVEVVADGTVKPLSESQTGGKPSRLRVGGDVQAPKLLDKVMPTYPASAKAAGVSGTVILHAIIGMDGRPLSLRVTNQPDPDLARAAIEAVSKWRYQPTLLNGEPIEVDTTVTVSFTLYR